MLLSALCAFQPISVMTAIIHCVNTPLQFLMVWYVFHLPHLIIPLLYIVHLFIVKYTTWYNFGVIHNTVTTNLYSCKEVLGRLSWLLNIRSPTLCFISDGPWSYVASHCSVMLAPYVKCSIWFTPCIPYQQAESSWQEVCRVTLHHIHALDHMNTITT